MGVRGKSSLSFEKKMKLKGLKKFVFDGIIIYAINEKNAQRKLNKKEE